MQNNNTKVVHCKRENYDIYIGRPGFFGNPYTHIADKHTLAKFVVSSREEAVEKYREWILSPEALSIRSQLYKLEGKTLGCWCKPKACHGDVIIELIEQGKRENWDQGI